MPFPTPPQRSRTSASTGTPRAYFQRAIERGNLVDAEITLHAIARRLEDDGVRPVRGGLRLYPATVARMLAD